MTIIEASMTAAFAAVFAAVVVFLYLLNQRGVAALKLLPDLLIGVVAAGVIVGFVGMWVGAAILCLVIEATQCGFGGALMGGPLGLAIGIAGFLCWWTRRVTAP